MVKKSHKENIVGPWAKQKLDALESYLIAYQRVMENFGFTTVYVDAFAGAGEFKVRNIPAEANPSEIIEGLLHPEDFKAQDEFIKGSPVRALSLEKPFDHYRFIDTDPSRIELLNELKADFPVRKLKAIVGDANEEVQNIAANFGAPNLRGVAFLDPYGPHLEWDTVVSLANTKKFDVIINIPIQMAVNRLIRNDGNISAETLEQLDQYFGTRDWYDVSYESHTDLFGENVVQKRGNATQRQLELYVRRLREIFSHVSRPSLVTNTQGHPLYYLIWAGENKTGFQIGDHILGLGDKVTVPRKKA